MRRAKSLRVAEARPFQKMFVFGDAPGGLRREVKSHSLAGCAHSTTGGGCAQDNLTQPQSRRGLIGLVAFMFLPAVIFGLVSGAGAFKGVSTQPGNERKLNVRHFGETPPILVGAEVGAHVRNHLDAKPGWAYALRHNIATLTTDGPAPNSLTRNVEE